MENAYIYTRVSTLIQVDGFSLEAQEAEIRAFAEARKINIVGKYTDEGKSGKNAEHRPAFTQMMEDIRSKKDNIRSFKVHRILQLTLHGRGGDLRQVRRDRRVPRGRGDPAGQSCRVGRRQRRKIPRALERAGAVLYGVNSVRQKAPSDCPFALHTEASVSAFSFCVQSAEKCGFHHLFLSNIRE